MSYREKYRKNEERRKPRNVKENEKRGKWKAKKVE
jgi:hypothetical protein